LKALNFCFQHQLSDSCFLFVGELAHLSLDGYFFSVHSDMLSLHFEGLWFVFHGYDDYAAVAHGCHLGYEFHLVMVLSPC
jgi:hypothetical protein